MNLWSLFPEFILRVDGILQLPYLAILFYFYVVYAFIKIKSARALLALFVLLTIVASTLMLMNLGPQGGKVIPPLSLLTVMVMPLVVLIVYLVKQKYNLARIWFMVSIAGWLHSLSWAVWLFALARS